MATIKATGFVLILLVVPVMLESCCWGSEAWGVSCRCERKSAPTHMNINGVSYVDARTYPFTAFSPTSSGQLSKIAFFFQRDLQFSRVESGSGSLLYACTIAPPIANQTISSINITSDSPLTTPTTVVPAGDDLAATFKVGYIGGYNETEVPLSEFINKQFLLHTFWLRSEAKADKSQTHTFKFKITLDDGRVFNLASKPIELLPG